MIKPNYPQDWGKLRQNDKTKLSSRLIKIKKKW